MDEDEETRREYPLWLRIAMAALMLGAGAGIGALAQGGWAGVLFGAVVASPLALLAFLAPGVLAGILMVLEVFSCAT